MCSDNFSPNKSIWLCLSVLVLLLQGNLGQITVTQIPSVVVSKLNQNATLPCTFSHTADKRVTGVILYWIYNGTDGEDLYAHPKSHAEPLYKNRVIIPPSSRVSEDKSMVLLNVSWTDSHKYHCMLSYETQDEPERKRGTGVLLLLHDSMTFDLVPGKEKELQCSVRVSPDDGFTLRMFEDGVLLRNVRNFTKAPHVTLSHLVSLHDNIHYECRLSHDSSGVILSETYQSQSQVLPEPVFLYTAILLVPFIILVIILIAVLIRKSKR